jgi:probable rRNA maturation factor
MEVEVFDRQSSLLINKEQVKSLVLCTLDFIQLMGSHICIHFVSQEESGRIHAEHFSDPSPTDCMTFPIDDKETPNRHLGECVICPAIAIEYAKEHGLDPFEELSLYIVHTLLHLNEMSDNDEKSALKMREWEVLCMNNLKKNNLLLKS